MKIYTKKGDAGKTSLLGGERVGKEHLRVRSYGSIDELNALIGLVRSEPGVPPDLHSKLLVIQGQLFQLGGELAASPKTAKKIKALKCISEKDVKKLEEDIDAIEERVERVNSFILPGGARLSGLLSYACTVARRAEREIVALHRREKVRSEVLCYVNRLSDYLFMRARMANIEAGVPEVLSNLAGKDQG
jgi:cob(I)alamin adenosyltransferase